MEPVSLGAFFGIVGLLVAAIGGFCYGLYKLVITVIINRKPACTPTLMWDSRWNGFTPSDDFTNNPTTFTRNSFIYASTPNTFLLNPANIILNSKANCQNQVVVFQPSSNIRSPTSMIRNPSSIQALRTQMNASTMQDFDLGRAGSPASNYSYSEALFAINRTQPVGGGANINGQSEARPDGSTSLALSMYDLMTSSDNLRDVPTSSYELHRDEFRQVCCFDFCSWNRKTENSHACSEPVMLKLEMRSQNSFHIESTNTSSPAVPTFSLTDVVRQNRSHEDATHTTRPQVGDGNFDEYRISQDVAVESGIVDFVRDLSINVDESAQQENLDRRQSLSFNPERSDNIPLSSVGEVFEQRTNDKKDSDLENKKPLNKCESLRTELSKVPINSNYSTELSDELIENSTGPKKKYDTTLESTEFEKRVGNVLLETEIEVFPTAVSRIISDSAKKSLNNCTPTKKPTRRSRKRLHRHSISQTSIAAKPTDLDAAQRSLHQSASVSNLSTRCSVHSRDYSSSFSKEDSTHKTFGKVKVPFVSENETLSRKGSSSSGSSVDSVLPWNQKGTNNHLRSQIISTSTSLPHDSAEIMKMKKITLSKPTDFDEANSHTISGVNSFNGGVGFSNQFSFKNVDNGNGIPEVHAAKQDSSIAKTSSPKYL